MAWAVARVVIRPPAHLAAGMARRTVRRIVLVSREAHPGAPKKAPEKMVARKPANGTAHGLQAIVAIGLVAVPALMFVRLPWVAGGPAQAIGPRSLTLGIRCSATSWEPINHRKRPLIGTDRSIKIGGRSIRIGRYLFFSSHCVYSYLVLFQHGAACQQLNLAIQA